jgi:hypothetical protein
MTLRICAQRAALRQLSLAAALVACTLVLPGCSKADETKASAAPAATSAAPAAESGFAAPQPEPQAPPPPPTADAASWTPAALDELLAPVALYPDPVLAQVLAASTNSQEVLDAGNWLLDNQSLKGDALTKAASAAGFSPSVQALVQFPTVLDMMCRELDWTKQLGDAFTADQGAVLAAVQRLRAQAVAVGSLKSSPEMAVEKTAQSGKEVIIVKPADPQIVYVPQYNPTQVYTAPPAATTTTATNSSGLTTTEAVMGGLLAFGAGILVANAFDNDNDHNHGYYPYPNYGYGGMYYGGRPYYPPPYRPAYPGYRPTPYYRPPANYGNQYNRYGNNNSNNNVNVNVNNNNNYFNRFDKNQNRLPNYQARSPVAATGANTSAAYKGQAGQYKGADMPRPTAATPTSGQRAGQQPATRPSGSYKGADAPQNRQTTAAARGAQQADYKGAATSAQRPGGGADRGYPKTTGNRPDASPAVQNHGGGTFSGAGANQGSRERAASERGRSSMKAAPRPSSQRSRSGSGSRSASRAR